MGVINNLLRQGFFDKIVIIVVTNCCITFFHITVYNASLLDSKIINGNLANETELPYMASLQIEGKHICGGCLISEEHVLSSAQCIIHILKYGGHNFINATVVIGVTDLSKNGIIHTIRYVHHFHYTRNNEFIVEEAYDVGLILVMFLTKNTVLIGSLPATHNLFSIF